MSTLSSFLKDNFFAEHRMTVLFFQHFKDMVPLSSRFHGFWWEIHSHSNNCSPLYNVSFSGCFQDLSLSLFFSSFIIMWLGMVFFGLSLLGGWATLIYKLISFTKFGNFLAKVSSNIFSAPLFIFSWESNDTSVKTFCYCSTSPQDLFIFFNIFCPFSFPG